MKFYAGVGKNGNLCAILKALEKLEKLEKLERLVNIEKR